MKNLARRVVSSPSVLPAVISAAALAAATAHALWPMFQPDTTTLVLLGVAALPWLAPLVKSIEGFGFKVELQDLREEVNERLAEGSRQVQTLEKRVRDVEGFVFAGKITPELQGHLNDALERFDSYLKKLGGAGVADRPTIRVDDNAPTARLDEQRNEIVINSAADVSVALRQYALRMVDCVRPDAVASNDPAINALASGLADYYACSFGESPRAWHNRAPSPESRK